VKPAPTLRKGPGLCGQQVEKATPDWLKSKNSCAAVKPEARKVAAGHEAAGDAAEVAPKFVPAFPMSTPVVFAFAVLASVMLLPLHDAPNPAAPEQTLPKIAPAPEFALISQDGAQLHPTLSA